MIEVKEFVTVRFVDGSSQIFERPIAYSQILMNVDTSNPIVAVKVNGRENGLNRNCQLDTILLQPIFMNSEEGQSVYRRSLVFLCAMAAMEEFGKNWLITVEHSISKGYRCEKNCGEEILEDEIIRLENKMREIVARDMIITEGLMSYDTALSYFKETNRPYSEAFVYNTNEGKHSIVKCGNFKCLYRRCLVPRTSYLKEFNLNWEQSSFIINFPKADIEEPLELQKNDEVISKVYKEYNEWGKILGIDCIGRINHRITKNESKNLLAISESIHNRKIVDVAEVIKSRINTVKLILIAGPSASGKTTFASKLKLQLQILGMSPTIISCDNYFKSREETPKLEDGSYDFESIEAIRMDRLNDDLLKLFEGASVQTPIFDFVTGSPKIETNIIEIPKENGILIMEGIHCLNDKLTQRISLETKFKIFVAPLSQLNIDEYNFMPHPLTRLLRRVVRDFSHRGYSSVDVLKNYHKVTNGENEYIFPYISSADIIYNTALDYEPCVLSSYAVPLLQSIKPSSECYNMARNLMSMLQMFFQIPHDHVPPTSLLREFIGGSIFL